MAFSAPFPKTRGINNTTFDNNGDLTTQLSGMGNPIAGSISPVYAATIALDAIMMYSRFVSITTTSAVGNATVTTNVGANPGGRLVIQVNNDASGNRTITFGTGFRPEATIVGTASKALLVEFVSDGTTWNEVARSSGALT